MAKYVDILGGQSQIPNPFLTSLSDDDTAKDVKFSLTVDITSAALCGRFTTKCKSTGGN